MNEKLNTQNLIYLLAEKHGMDKKDADCFVKEFFVLIEESLEKDRYVKIKGLGTFKLIGMSNRESVNINTGERFELQGYTKVSFTPEPTLKEIINRPFAHFESVALCDNTVFDDSIIEDENENEEEENSDLKAQEAKEATADCAEEKHNIILSEEKRDAEQEEFREQSTEQLEAPVAKVNSSSLLQKEITEAKSEQPEIVKKDNRDAATIKFFIGIVAFVVVLCGGAVAFMYFPDLMNRFTPELPVDDVIDDKKEVPTDEIVMTDSILINEKEAIRKDSIVENLTATTKPEKVLKETVDQPIAKEELKKTTAVKPDSVGYTIVGTETNYTIKEGETLTKVSLRFYGIKDLWPYIAKHNVDVIKNPDNVPFGTTIKIPRLVKKQ